MRLELLMQDTLVDVSSSRAYLTQPACSPLSNLCRISRWTWTASALRGRAWRCCRSSMRNGCCAQPMPC